MKAANDSLELLKLGLDFLKTNQAAHGCAACSFSLNLSLMFNLQNFNDFVIHSDHLKMTNIYCNVVMCFVCKGMDFFVIGG